MDKLTRGQIERELALIEEEVELEAEYELRVRRQRPSDGTGWVIWIQRRGVCDWCSDPIVNAMSMAVATALMRLMLEVMTRPANVIEEVRSMKPSGCQF